MKKETILALDPGQTTGSVLWFDSGSADEEPRVVAQDFGPRSLDNWGEAVVNAAEGIRDMEHYVTRIVMEDFRISGRTLKGKLNRSSITLQGWVEVEAARLHIPVKIQGPDERIRVTPRDLEKANMYLKGKQYHHSRDAARHLFVWLARTKISPWFNKNVLEVGNA